MILIDQIKEAIIEIELVKLTHRRDVIQRKADTSLSNSVIGFWKRMLCVTRADIEILEEALKNVRANDT